MGFCFKVEDLEFSSGAGSLMLFEPHLASLGPSAAPTGRAHRGSKRFNSHDVVSNHSTINVATIAETAWSPLASHWIYSSTKTNPAPPPEHWPGEAKHGHPLEIG